MNSTDDPDTYEEDIDALHKAHTGSVRTVTTVQGKESECTELTGAVQEFLEFVRTQTDVVRIECTALHTPGEWPKIAEFRVESRNDDGGTEIEHWSVQKARM